MCKTNCYCNTPTSQTENQKPGSCARRAMEEQQVKQLSLFPEWESGCCGNATALAVDSVADQGQSVPGLTEDELGRQYLEAWWDAPIIERRRSYLATLWKRFVASIT